MGEGMSDHFHHPGLDAIELLEPVRMGPELVHGPNVLSPQHVPGDGGQIEISDWPCAGIVETGHRTLLSLTGGSARISQPPRMPKITYTGGRSPYALTEDTTST